MLIRPLGALLGLAALGLAGHERQVAAFQLNRAYRRLTGNRSAVMLRGIAVSLGRNVLEATALVKKGAHLPDILFPDASRITLERALTAGRGVVFVTGHLGNWELMAAWLAERGYPIHTVVRSSYDDRFTRLIDAARQKRGIKTILRGAPGSAAAMLRALHSGAVLGFLIDQDTDVPSVFVPFFGRRAKTPVGPAVLAARCGAPVVIGTMHRRLDGCHTIHIEPCDLDGDVESDTAAFTAALESRIRRHPSQWIWFHKRWRSNPAEVVRCTRTVSSSTR